MAIDALRVPYYSPSHPRAYMFRKINVILEPDYANLLLLGASEALSFLARAESLRRKISLMWEIPAKIESNGWRYGI